MIRSHTCVPSLCQTNRAGRKFFLILFSLSDSTRLCQRSASLSLASCVPASIYTPVCGPPRPRSVVYDLSRITLTVKSKQDTPSEALVQNQALDASAVLTGHSVCVSFTGSVRGDGDHLHGGRAALQQHVQVQSEGLQHQRSGPVQQDPDHADL